MPELQDLTRKLEYLFLRIIIKNLKDSKFNIKQASGYADTFLKIEPFSSIEDAKTKMNIFAQNDQEFLELSRYVDAYVAEKQTESKVRQMRKLLKENKIEEVLKIATK